MKSLLYLLILCWGLPLMAQEEQPLPGEGEYWTLGVGIPITTVRDKTHSPLAYRGRGLRFFTTYENIRPKSVMRVQMSFDNISMKAYVRPRQQVRRSAKLRDFKVGVGYFRSLDGEATGMNQQYVGATWSLQFNNRRYPLPSNNIVGLLAATSFGVGAMDRRQLNNENWFVTTAIELPLLSAVYRPAYIGIPQFLNVPKVKFKQFASKFKIVTVDQFLRLNAEVNVDYARRPWRSDRLIYLAELLYTPIPAPKSFLSATSGLAYGYRVLQ